MRSIEGVFRMFHCLGPFCRFSWNGFGIVCYFQCLVFGWKTFWYTHSFFLFWQQRRVLCHVYRQFRQTCLGLRFDRSVGSCCYFRPSLSMISYFEHHSCSRCPRLLQKRQTRLDFGFSFFRCSLLLCSWPSC